MMSQCTVSAILITNGCCSTRLAFSIHDLRGVLRVGIKSDAKALRFFGSTSNLTLQDLDGLVNVKICPLNKAQNGTYEVLDSADLKYCR